MGQPVIGTIVTSCTDVREDQSALGQGTFLKTGRCLLKSHHYKLRPGCQLLEIVSFCIHPGGQDRDSGREAY